MRLFVFRHDPGDSMGFLLPVLETRNVHWSYVDLWAGSQVDSLPSEADGLIFLGGSMSVNDDLPWLRTETSIIDQALRADIPILGICLGAQLLAKALRGRVGPNPVAEIGWFAINPGPAAATDPLLRHFRDPEPVFQWHRETFSLPDGAVHLASSQVCANQAFRYGARNYGFQFHLEASPEVIGAWLRADARCGDPEVPTAIDPFQHAARMEALAKEVFNSWLDML